jgi:hypothetical protein
MAKRNYSHIAVRDDTKQIVDELKKKLCEKYNDATYDELMKILLNKHEKILISEKEINELIAKSRGVRI